MRSTLSKEPLVEVILQYLIDQGVKFEQFLQNRLYMIRHIDNRRLYKRHDRTRNWLGFEDDGVTIRFHNMQDVPIKIDYSDPQLFARLDGMINIIKNQHG